MAVLISTDRAKTWLRIDTFNWNINHKVMTRNEMALGGHVTGCSANQVAIRVPIRVSVNVSGSLGSLRSDFVLDFNMQGYIRVSQLRLVPARKWTKSFRVTLILWEKGKNM